MSEKIVVGFVVKSAEGQYLTRNLWWHQPERPVDVYIFTLEQVQEIKAAAVRDNWEFKPAFVIPAIFSDEQVHFTSEAISIDNLPA